MDKLESIEAHRGLTELAYQKLKGVRMWAKIQEIVDWINEHEVLERIFDDKFLAAHKQMVLTPSEPLHPDVDSVGAPSIDLIIGKSVELTHLLKERKRIRSEAKAAKHLLERCQRCNTSLQWIEISSDYPVMRIWDCPDCYYGFAPKPKRDPNGPPFYT